VLVVGGGPAGSTIAALLAQKGRHVVVLEKERFPRFHIGESLLPLNLPLFERLGVAKEVERIGVYKPGAEVVSDEHAQATTFRFDHNPYLSANHSYHVRRADFDLLLLDNSRRLGATALEGTRVTEVEFGNVDASGRDTLLLKRLRLKRADKRYAERRADGGIEGGSPSCRPTRPNSIPSSDYGCRCRRSRQWSGKHSARGDCL